jgi:hypothetical protein
MNVQALLPFPVVILDDLVETVGGYDCIMCRDGGFCVSRERSHRQHECIKTQAGFILLLSAVKLIEPSVTMDHEVAKLE